MKFGIEVGLSPSHTVLDGNPAPQFSAHDCCGQMAGWIKMPLDTKVGLGPGDIVLDGGPSSHPPRKKMGAQPQNFRPMSIMAKRSPIAATAELLFTMFQTVAIFDVSGSQGR